MQDHDDSARLLDVVDQALAGSTELEFRGHASKPFAPSQETAAHVINTVEHTGVIEYQPDELVLTVRSGTPLKDINSLLHQHEQMLPFEPPMFDGRGTIGGAVACGYSGPGRPWYGSVRDCILGVELISGRAERLRFGGQVVKNVAGYDVSRLQVGAFGTLGLLLSVSIKLLPQPLVQRTLTFPLSAAAAIVRVRRWARRSLPITATLAWNDQLWVRLSGSVEAVDAAESYLHKELDGELVVDDDLWEQARDQQLPFFNQTSGLWRLSVPGATTNFLSDSTQELAEWGGYQRWLATDMSHEEVQTAARQVGGSATPWVGVEGVGRLPSKLSNPVANTLNQRLKLAFDPNGLLNRHAN